MHNKTLPYLPDKTGRERRTMEYKFTIPGKLDGLNEYTSANRTNPYKGGKMKRDNESAVKNEQVYEFEERFCDLTNSGLTEYGQEKVKRWIGEFGLVEIIDCMEISVSQYFDSSDERTIKKAFDYIPRIASVRKKQEQDPMYGKRNYIKGILRNRLNYINDVQLAIRLKKIKSEEEYEDAKEIALTCESWTDFRETFDDLTGESNYGY